MSERIDQFCEGLRAKLTNVDHSMQALRAKIDNKAQTAEQEVRTHLDAVTKRIEAYRAPGAFVTAIFCCSGSPSSQFGSL